MNKTSQEYSGALADLAWSCWVELGVSGWRQRSVPWCIDPEALILLTGSLAHVDPRLRDESLAWCARFRSFLSRSRLTFLHKSWPPAQAWKDYAAALSGATRESWPGSGPPQEQEMASKERHALSNSPALLSLRIRAVMGATARSEVIRTLLTSPQGRRLGVAEIADEAGYTKRNVASALSDLATVGIVMARREGNADSFSIEGKRDAVLKLFGPVPVETGSFAARCRALLILTGRLATLEGADPRVQFVEATRALTDAGQDLGRSGIPLYLIPNDAEPGPPVHGWMGSLIENLLAMPQHPHPMR